MPNDGEFIGVPALTSWLKTQTMVAGAECQETLSQIEGERLTLEFSSKSTRRVDAGRRPIEESPLFGGDSQQDLF